MKTCSRCKVEKTPSEFWKRVLSNDGLNAACKECCSSGRKDRLRKFRELHPIKPPSDAKVCRKCGVEKSNSEFDSYARGGRKQLRSRCKGCLTQHRHDRYWKDPEKFRRAANDARAKDVEAARAYGRERYWKDPVAARAKQREHIRKNPEAYKTRYHSDLGFKLSVNLRGRIHKALKWAGVNKSERTKELIGCPVVWLEAWLESLFKPGMTWENYGPVWHIDHVKPCAAFDLTDPEQQKICFHWSNQQPLFAKENIQKGAKI